MMSDIRRRPVVVRDPYFSDLGPPRWVAELLGCVARVEPEPDVVTCHGWSLVSLRVPGAATLSADELTEQTRRAYEALGNALRPLSARHLVRVWNYIPQITDDIGGGLERYMAFNAGRFQAYETLYGGIKAFDRAVATASGVGHAGSDLVLHALAASTAGSAVDNPRQVVPHRYSERFGPVPPCFARATAVASATGTRLLVGGTASVRGEQSVHVGDLTAQLSETFENLAAVAASGFPTVKLLDQLKTYRELRVYHARAADSEIVLSAVLSAFPTAARIELVRADLCRRDLLVEIEGVAEAAAN